MSYTIDSRGDYFGVFEDGSFLAEFKNETEAKLYINMKLRWSPDELNKIWLDTYNNVVSRIVLMEDERMMEDQITAALLLADTAVRSILEGRVLAVMKKVANELEVPEPLA